MGVTGGAMTSRGGGVKIFVNQQGTIKLMFSLQSLIFSTIQVMYLT